MKNISTMVTLLVICLICSGCYGEEGTVQNNEMPMYGGIPPTPEEQKIHSKFIDTVIKEGGGREAAVEEGLKTAWYYFSKHDYKIAMRRFNQVWLLDPDNEQVFYGFGLLMELDGNMAKAIEYYKKALEINPKNAQTMCYLATVSSKKALEDKANEDFEKALILYEKASNLAATESNYSDYSGKIYEDWAMALFMNKNYAEAWNKVKLAKQHGQKIHPELINGLSKVMPEPE